jgi:phage terminase large subunit GpA-like protein
MTPPEAVLAELGRFEGDADLLRAWSRGMTPEPALLVSDWADRHRVLGSRGSAEPGPWRTARTPYLKAVMDALSPAHPARRVVFMKGAQVGGTECGNNWIGYVIHHAPGPMLAVQPTTELAKRFSDQRIDPLIEETPALRERVAPARSRDSGNRQLSKEFAGGQLVMTGANSAVGLRSMSARFLFLDEIDAYPGDVEGEGDPIALAEARARTFGWRRKVLLVSTPTIAGLSRIEREYLATDQRRFFVPCPRCGVPQWLRFERLVWTEGAPETAHYRCEACDGAIEERHKTTMLAAGEWRPTAESTDPHAIGFHLSALYSPVGWLSWAEVARGWEAARGRPEDLKTFRNTVLGETWREASDPPDAARLLDRRETRPRGEVPSGGLLLTGACDVQGDRLEWDIWAWAEGLTAWLVDTGVIEASPHDPRAWAALRAVTERRYAGPDGRLWAIDAFGIDAGYASQEVYRFVLHHPDRERIFALDGRGEVQAPALGGPKRVDVDYQGRKLGTVALWPVGTHGLKLAHYAALRRTIEGPGEEGGWPEGAMRLPAWVHAEYLTQLTSEVLETVRPRSGGPAKLQWRRMPNVRNERLDTAVYARALAHHLTDHLSGLAWATLRDRRTAQPVPRARPQRRRDGDDRGWFEPRDDWFARD